jgi:hypothetical protein
MLADNNWRFQATSLDRPYHRVLGDASNALVAGGFNFNNPDRVNAASRVMPSPSGTNWNSTFGNNSPSSPSGTDWAKTFGSPRSSVGAGQSSSLFGDNTRSGESFSLGISPSSDSRQLSIGSDLTSKDHELYGAGTDYGFTY